MPKPNRLTVEQLEEIKARIDKAGRAPDIVSFALNAIPLLVAEVEACWRERTMTSLEDVLAYRMFRIIDR